VKLINAISCLALAVLCLPAFGSESPAREPSQPPTQEACNSINVDMRTEAFKAVVDGKSLQPIGLPRIVTSGNTKIESQEFSVIDGSGKVFKAIVTCAALCGGGESRGCNIGESGNCSSGCTCYGFSSNSECVCTTGGRMLTGSSPASIPVLRSSAIEIEEPSLTARDLLLPESESKAWNPPPSTCINGLACSLPQDCPGGFCNRTQDQYGQWSGKCVCLDPF